MILTGNIAFFSVIYYYYYYYCLFIYCLWWRGNKSPRRRNKEFWLGGKNKKMSSSRTVFPTAELGQESQHYATYEARKAQEVNATQADQIH